MSFASYHRLSNWVPNQSLGKILLYNGTKCNNLILKVMDIYENMRNKRKMVERNKEGVYNITLMYAANFSRLPNLLPN